MRFGDRIIQRWRVGKAISWIPDQARLLDIGCDDGFLFRELGGRLGFGVGVDPGAAPTQHANYQIVRGLFPDQPSDREPFNVVVALAVLEHVPRDEQAIFVESIGKILMSRGVVVLTVPSPLVDRLLHLLSALRITDGMAAHEHWGFKPRHVKPLFVQCGFETIVHRRFQLGLNNLFVFRKIPDTAP